MESVMPAVTEGYEIRNPSFHTPIIKRRFAECSLHLLLVDYAAKFGKLPYSVNII